MKKISMSTEIRIEKLTESNFSDYESLTRCQADGGCYCAFWHQKWTSMADWEKQQKEAPEKNRAIIFEKVRAHFHVGVLAYKENKLLAWVSVGPLTDFYWTWKRTIQVGESAKTIAGITCITLAPEFRGQGLQAELLLALSKYGTTQGWTAIEGYPFDVNAVKQHKQKVFWPGLTKGFERAGYKRIGPHWLNHPEWERSIYQFELIKND